MSKINDGWSAFPIMSNWTAKDFSIFVANAILLAGGQASTAFRCALVMAEDLESREASTRQASRNQGGCSPGASSQHP